MYDQVSQLVPVQQVDDIDEVHQLDPVHQVDHKDECSKISCKKDTIRWTSQGSKKDFFQHFFKSRGHLEGSDFQPFVRGVNPPSPKFVLLLLGGVYPPRAKIVLLLLGGSTPPGENRTAAAAPSLVTLFSTVSQKCHPRLGTST